ncbi:MAG: cell division protein SepF [Actinomycetota bacterium]
MANVFKKAANYLGLVDEEDDIMEATASIDAHHSVRSVSQTTRPTFNPIPASTRSLHSAPAPAATQGASPIMDQIFTIHPRFYNEARTVGERYRLEQPVLMNLSDMEESERKRLVDFASGLVFGLHGSIERVTSKVFLLTPANVRVSSENKTAAAEASFFNQS